MTEKNNLVKLKLFLGKNINGAFSDWPASYFEISPSEVKKFFEPKFVKFIFFFQLLTKFCILVEQLHCTDYLMATHFINTNIIFKPPNLHEFKKKVFNDLHMLLQRVHQLLEENWNQIVWIYISTLTRLTSSFGNIS